ncbi:MAG: PIN domain-containing protein [Clostridiales bacterium]|jgi:predicted nucleic acid-binding protein|nr:PIN domain-containing protein [Clostridiales bacterium]
MNIFVDTNVLIDVIAKRSGFFEASAQILRQCEAEIHKGNISALSIANIMYICKKYVSKEILSSAVQSLAKIFEIIDLTQKDISGALSLDIADFEDALQFLAAKRAKADYIITRDIAHFKNSKIIPLTPENFLKML